MYIQPKINKALDSAIKIMDESDIDIGTKGCADLITQKLRDYKVGGIIVVSEITDVCDPDQTIIAGSADPIVDYEKYRESDITITIAVSKPMPFRDGIGISRKEFKFELSKTIQHELIHRHHHTLRQFEYFGDSGHGYLDDPSELEARAHDIVLDLTSIFSYNDVIGLLKTPGKAAQYSGSLNFYDTIYDDWSDPVIKKLLKSVYDLLESCKWMD